MRYGYATLPKLWAERGLPVDPEAAREKLGFTEIETPLDEVIAVGRGKKTFAEHLAEAIADPERRKPLAATLAKDYSCAEIVELCVEACKQEEGYAFQDTVLEIFDSLGPDLVPALHALEVFREIQMPDGRVTNSTQLAGPALLVLARRDPALSDDKLDQLWSAAGRHLMEPILVALPPERRARKLADAYRNVPSWDTDQKLRFETAMLAAPHPLLTAELVARVKELKESYTTGRMWETSLFSEGYPPAKLKKLKPRNHPLVKKLLANIEAYAKTTGDADLAKAIAQFLDL
jgi:hypothetical protein